MLRLLPLGLFFSRFLLAFGAEDPVKGNPFYHEELTRLGASDAGGWSTRGAEGDPDSSAVDSLAWHADFIDSYLYNWLWNAGGGIGRAKSALFAHDDLVKLHFDDLTSTAQIRVVWNRYLAGTVAGLLWAAERGDVPAARHVVGVSLHAVQDFYSHSNWVDDPQRRPRDGDEKKTWFDFSSAELESMFLYTGTYELADQHGFKHHGKLAFDCKVMHEINGFLKLDAMDLLCGGISPLSGTGLCRRWRECKQDSVPVHPDVVLGVKVPDGIVHLNPPGIALDSKWLSQVNVVNRDLRELGQPDVDHKKLGLTLFGYATTLAQRHTALWLKDLDNIMTAAGEADFWADVKTRERGSERVGPVGIPVLSEYLTAYAEDAHQYEHKNKLPLTFLSAGAYPPSPLGADEGWFVRLRIRTADDEFGTGTNSDIDVAIGGKTIRLDHGEAENRLFEFNDFEGGDDTHYVVGPFDTMPVSMRLINNGTSLLDILAAAFADLAEFVSDLLDDIGTFLLSLIGGNEDYVGADKMTWTWEQLEELVGEPVERDFTWHVDGGAEGIYDVIGRIKVDRQPNGSLRVAVRPRFLRVIDESKPIDADDTPSEDEIFIMMLVNSPAVDQLRSMRTGIIEGLDSGEMHGFQVEPQVVEVPRHGGLIVPIQLWESDLETEETRDELQAKFTSEYADRTVSARSAFLDALGEAVLPDWKVAAFDAFAYRRGALTEVATLADNQQVNRWIEAGRSLTLDFTPAPVRRVKISRLLPAVQAVTMLPGGGVNGLAVGPAGVVAVAGSITGNVGMIGSFGTHLEPGPVLSGLPSFRSVAFDRERNRAYALLREGTVKMYDPSAMTELASATIGPFAIDIAVDPVAGLVYVSVFGTLQGRIVVLSAEDLSERSSHGGSLFLGPIGLAASTDPRQLFVARDFRSGGPGADTVTALTVFDVDPSGTLGVETTLPFSPIHLQPIDVAVDGNNVYLACLGSNAPGGEPRIMVIRRSEFTFEPIGEVQLKSPVRAVATRPNSNIAYVVGEAGLMYVDTIRMEHLLTVPLGRQPHCVAVDPQTGTAYVGDRLDGTISRVEAPTGLF